MKKLLAVVALATFTFGIANQEVQKKCECKEKTECKEKSECKEKKDCKKKKECKTKCEKSNAKKVAPTT